MVNPGLEGGSICDREVRTGFGDTGCFELVMVSGPIIDDGLVLAIDDRFSVVDVLVLLVRLCVFLDLTLVVRDRPCGAGDCGTLVEVARFNELTTGTALPSKAANESALAVCVNVSSSSAPSFHFCAGGLKPELRVMPPAPYIEPGRDNLDGGGIALLSAIASATLSSTPSSSSLIPGFSSFDAFLVNCGSRLLLLACFDVGPSCSAGSLRL